jgi:hypothetical protein
MHACTQHTIPTHLDNNYLNYCCFNFINLIVAVQSFQIFNNYNLCEHETTCTSAVAESILSFFTI